jgi:hypothetical protein
MADKKERPPVPPAKYTEQVVLLISKDARAVIDIVQREQGLSQAATARAFLYAGMRALGYTELRATDEPGNVGPAQHAIEVIKAID